MSDVTSRPQRVRGADSMLDGRETDVLPIPADQPQAGASLGELLAFFLRKPSPLIIGGTALTAAAARLWIGRWGWWDLLIPVIIVAAEPFVEWMIHVHVLHRRPTRLGRFTLSLIHI